MAIFVLGAFSTHQFAWAYQSASSIKEVRFGYEIFGFRHFYLIVPGDRIVRVDWHTGQASHFAGKDVGDWSVALWYEHGDSEKSRAQKNFRHPDWEVYTVGLTGPKEEIAAFGIKLLSFLRQSGVCLDQGKDECEYIRNQAPAEKNAASISGA